MKILIIAMNVGRTAPGIVFERLIHGLSKIHKVDVMTADMDPSFELSEVNRAFEFKRKPMHYRIPKLLISIFGINPFDWLWSKKAISRLRKNNYDGYDLVFSLISFHNYSPLLAGVFYSKALSSKLAVYSVDAIPAPIGWSKDDSYFSQVKRMMAKYLSKADMFFSVNEQMLKYQLTTFKTRKGFKSDVIYISNDGAMKKFGPPANDENTFLYTGGIYQARKPDYILKAFEQLLNLYPNSSFIFVSASGTRLTQESLLTVSEGTRKKIHLMPFTKDLNSYYQKATALIDIDADLENDVFLSSKIVNYLIIDRIIITETGRNSPSRQLFKGIESVIQCDHDADQLCEAMRKSIEMKNLTFGDRESVLKLFSLNNVISKLDCSLKNYFEDSIN